MLHEIVEKCLHLNKEIKRNNLVKLTWGNASVLSDDGKVIAIKPSGVDFESMKFKDISLVDLYSGNHLSGLKPSVDTAIHREIYKAFPEIKSVIHTHSKFATSWAQSRRPIPLCGTTHADYFLKDIPVSDILYHSDFEDYEKHIGLKIVEWYQKNKISPLNVPGILIPNHGCLVFSDSCERTLECAIVLEEVAEMAYYTFMLDSSRTRSLEEDTLYDIHFERKNGKHKYYGQ